LVKPADAGEERELILAAYVCGYPTSAAVRSIVETQPSRRHGSRLPPVVLPKRKSGFSYPRCLCTALMIATNETAAEEVISLLRTHAAELRAAGILHLSLFGSVARGEARADSDIDLAVEFDRDARMDLFALVGLERRLTEILGRKVDLIPEPVEKARLSKNLEKDRRRAF
jgi:uncharacterized protein